MVLSVTWVRGKADEGEVFGMMSFVLFCFSGDWKAGSERELE